MTEGQIEVLEKADALLAQYVALMQPLATALAEEKSLYVFGEPGHYKGELGCWEAGLNTICLHTVKPGGEPQTHGDPYRFHERCGDEAEAAGITHVRITGHF